MTVDQQLALRRVFLKRRTLRPLLFLQYAGILIVLSLSVAAFFATKNIADIGIWLPCPLLVVEAIALDIARRVEANRVLKEVANAVGDPFEET